MVAKRKNPIDELFDQFMEGLFKMAEFITGEARVKVESAGGASLSKEERGREERDKHGKWRGLLAPKKKIVKSASSVPEKDLGREESVVGEELKTESFLIVPIKSEQVGTEASKRTRKRKRVKMVEGDLFGG